MQDYMAWGIGAWRRTWKELDEYMPDHYMHYVCNHKSTLKKLRCNLRELYQLIFWTKNNPALDYRCDFTIACYCIINNKFVINPTFSLVRNMGNDGSGINCGALVDDYLARQPISKDFLFDIKDFLTENELKNCRTEWEEFKSKDFSNFQKKLVREYYYAYLILGYTIGNLFLNLKSLSVRLIKALFRKIRNLGTAKL